MKLNCGSSGEGGGGGVAVLKEAVLPPKCSWVADRLSLSIANVSSDPITAIRGKVFTRLALKVIWIH